MLVLASDGCSGELIGVRLRHTGCETFHDGRVESLLDGASRLLYLRLLFVNGSLRRVVLEDAVMGPKYRQ